MVICGDASKWKWVALKDNDKIICWGESLKEVFDKAKQKGFSDPILTKRPKYENEIII